MEVETNGIIRPIIVRDFRTWVIDSINRKRKSPASGFGAEIADTATLANSVMTLRQKKKKQPCQFFMKTGKCRYGDRCYHSHDRGSAGNNNVGNSNRNSNFDQFGIHTPIWHSEDGQVSDSASAFNGDEPMVLDGKKLAFDDGHSFSNETKYLLTSYGKEDCKTLIQGDRCFEELQWYARRKGEAELSRTLQGKNQEMRQQREALLRGPATSGITQYNPQGSFEPQNSLGNFENKFLEQTGGPGPPGGADIFGTQEPPERAQPSGDPAVMSDSLQAYKADNFAMGKIPLKPPDPSLVRKIVLVE
mmetsp:Transcript_18997/g.26494  ORF Transcript_18997/g.26494 Transcript_18997/m.26494 type:complete len:304 (+) Transcript_18997:346-1257(+)